MKSTSLRPILLAVTLCCVTCASAAPFRELRGTLRIRLLEQFNPRVAHISCASEPLDVYVGDGDRPVMTIPTGRDLQLTLDGDDVSVSGPSGEIHSGSFRLVTASEAELTVRLQGPTEPRSYLGSLVVSADQDDNELKIVNYVPLEDYVASVVASEYGLPDVEGSKAMAVIIRTYALKAINNSDDSYDHVDHTLSQVYRGTRTINAAARDAAESTRGEVLTHGGNLIEAVYSSSSGGHTANNEDVWQAGPHPYLRGHKDPYDTISPNHTWEYRVDRDRMHSFIEEAYGLDVKQVDVAERSNDGRARKMGLKTKNGRERQLSADEFRREFTRAFGMKALRSTLFTVKQRGGDYVFEGHGFGHGVGLSQWGAHAMARGGKSYREILNFYYTDVRLERRAVEGEDRIPVLTPRRPAPSGQMRPVQPRTDGWGGSSATSAPRPVTVVPPPSSTAQSVARPATIVPPRPEDEKPLPKPTADRPKTRRRVGW